MAKATRKQDVVIPGDIVLRLSHDEANVLADIFKRIGGQPSESRRGLVDGIARALREVDVHGKTNDDFDDFDDSQHYQAIYFK